MRVSLRFIPLLLLAVLSGHIPLVAQKSWHLTADLRIGGAESGAASFSTVRDIAVDSRGQIFILGDKTEGISLFDAAGKSVRAVGRQGAGPGEYREVNGMRLAPDGRLWVNDYGNARYVVFKGDGSFDHQQLVTDWGFGYA